jgi:hypothetical protein
MSTGTASAPRCLFSMRLTCLAAASVIALFTGTFARADDGELPTIDSVHPPSIRVSDPGCGARIERIAVDVRAANVSWITIEIAGPSRRCRRTSLSLAVPAGTRIVGMAVSAGGARAWSAARSQSQALADARREGDASLLAWRGTSDDHHHVRIDVEVTARIELAVELPPLSKLAIDAEGQTVGRIEAMVEGRERREWRRHARAVELDLRGIEGYVKTDAYPHAGPDTWLIVGAPNRDERRFEHRFGARPPGFWSDKPQIKRMMRLNRERITYCYERVAQWRGEIEGEVQLQFLIGTDGVVQYATATSALPAEINTCLEGVVKAWQFAATDGVTQVNYPLRFSTWK